MRDLNQRISQLEEEIEKIDKKEMKTQAEIQEKEMYLKKFQNDAGNMKQFVMKSLGAGALKQGSVKDLRDFYGSIESPRSGNLSPKLKMRIR